MNAMRSAALALRPSPRMPLWCWLPACGVLLGGLDLAFAAGFWWLRSGVDPIRIPQSIAAWVLGREAALSGGAATALLGLALYAHLTTAVLAAYYRLAECHARLGERAVLVGALYGVTVYGVLFEVVVPLVSAAPPRPHPIEWTLACMAAYPLLVGIPAALLTRHRLGESHQRPLEVQSPVGGLPAGQCSAPVRGLAPPHTTGLDLHVPRTGR